MQAVMVGGLDQRLALVLQRLKGSLKGGMAVGLADANGLPVAFYGPALEREAASAMATLLVSAASRTAEVLGLAAVRDVVIDAGGSSVLVRPVGDRFTLVVLLSETADLTDARIRCQDATDNLLIALETL